MVRPVDPDGEREPNATGEYQTCPDCGLPHKMDDTICSFCGSKLLRRVTLSEKLHRTVERLKWRYKLKTKRNNTSTVAKKVSSKLITVALALLLSAIGIWFFIRSGATDALSDTFLGILFLIYGVYALYVTVKR